MEGIYERAAQELLRAIRGQRSQVAFARRLGYRANPITDWENGRRFPTIDETLRAAELAKLPVQRAFEAFSPGQQLHRGHRTPIHLWLTELKGSRSIADLSKQTGRSRYAISRWLSGNTEPRLPDFLRLLDALSARLHDWVHALVGVEKVPTLYGRFAQVQAARRLALERPWSEAVLRVLETEDYQRQKRHHDGYISERLDIDESEVRDLLAELVEARIVKKTRQCFSVVSNLTVDTSSSPEQLRVVRKHWAQVGLKRLENEATCGSPPGDWFAYNVIAISQEDSKRIEQRLRAAYREVRGIVAESKPAEIPAVLTMHLVRW